MYGAGHSDHVAPASIPLGHWAGTAPGGAVCPGHTYPQTSGDAVPGSYTSSVHSTLKGAGVTFWPGTQSFHASARRGLMQGPSNAESSLISAAFVLVETSALKGLGRKHATSEILALDVLYKVLHPGGGILSGARKGKARQHINKRAQWLADLPEWGTFSATHGAHVLAILQRRAEETKEARSQRAAPTGLAVLAAAATGAGRKGALSEPEPEHEHEPEPQTHAQHEGELPHTAAAAAAAAVVAAAAAAAEEQEDHVRRDERARARAGAKASASDSQPAGALAQARDRSRSRSPSRSCSRQLTALACDLAAGKATEQCEMMTGQCEKMMDDGFVEIEGVVSDACFLDKDDVVLLDATPLKDWRSIADIIDSPGTAPKRSEGRQFMVPGLAPSDALKQKLEGATFTTVEHLREVGMLGPDGAATHAMEENVLLLRAKPGCGWQSFVHCDRASEHAMQDGGFAKMHYSVMVALMEDTSLWVKPIGLTTLVKKTIRRGNALAWRGDVGHSGTAHPGGTGGHYRLFMHMDAMGRRITKKDRESLFPISWE